MEVHPHFYMSPVEPGGILPVGLALRKGFGTFDGMYFLLYVACVGLGRRMDCVRLYVRQFCYLFSTGIRTLKWWPS